MPDAVAGTSRFHDLARRALTEITPDETIGAEAPEVDEGDGVVSVRFATLLPGYPGWFWTVSVAQVEGEEPTVLEVELLPGDHALVAPDWVPWADRLADMKAQEARDGDEDDTDDDDDESDDDDDESDDDESDDDDDDDDESEDDDDDDSDDDDSDDEPRSVVHGGDVDGVDIDGLGGDDETGDDDADGDDQAGGDDSHDDEWDGEDVDPLGGRRS